MNFIRPRADIPKYPPPDLFDRLTEISHALAESPKKDGFIARHIIFE
jgi:hypothetical protein